MNEELTDNIVWARTREGPWCTSLNSILKASDLIGGAIVVWRGRKFRIPTSYCVDLWSIDRLIGDIRDNACAVAGVSGEILAYPAIPASARVELKRRIEDWLDSYDIPQITKFTEITSYTVVAEDLKKYVEFIRS